MKKNLKRFVAAFLVSVMFFTDCVSGVAAETDTLNELAILDRSQDVVLSESLQAEFSQEPEAEEESPQVLFELEEFREQSEKHYRLSDGTILAAQYGMDVHYEDENGEWEEIDNRFLYEEAETSEDFDGFRSAEGAVEFKFAPQVQEGELVKITQGEYSVGFELQSPVSVETYDLRNGETIGDAETSRTPITFLQGDVLNTEEIPQGLLAVPAAMSLEEDTEVIWADVSTGVPEEEERELLDSIKTENAVTSVGYGNVLPGVSLQYVMAGSSLKEYILVNEKSNSYSYDFVMNLENLEPEMQEDGSILLKDAERGNAVYEIPAGYMQDAAGEYSDAVSMEVEENGEGNWILNVTADAEWINAEGRVFPVQIDPTLNYLLDSLTNIRGSYVSEGHPTTENVQYGNLMVGYDSSGSKQLRTYIQLRNLPVLPKDSVLCGAICHFGVVDFSYIGDDSMNIRAKKLSESSSWSDNFTWNQKPATDSQVLDYRFVNTGTKGKYMGWNITELVKAHYQNGNISGKISAFALEAYGGTSMNDTNCAKATLRLTRTTAYPVLQILYRDTKGIEGYYTYQMHDVGNAGAAYVGDYNGQLTLVRPVAAYESTIMSYGLSLVYNSSYSDKYFTNDGVNIHTKNYTNMKLGHGWKLSAQETVTSVSVQNLNGTTEWLVYNDSDGTEHYFKKLSDNSSKYEDEDGLNLTITKNGSDYTMTDSKDNQKYFKNGYLTKIMDAGGNAIHIIYNGGTASSNIPNSSGSNRITSVSSQPTGSPATEIFTLTYDSSNLLTKIEENYGNSHKIEYITDGNGNYQLKKISSYDSGRQAYVETAKYGYGSGPYALRYVSDVDADKGMYYNYTNSPTGYRINHFYECAAGDSGELTGTKVNAFQDELRKTVYRDYGVDRTANTMDDILTTYLFDSFGHTINISSKDQDGNLLGVTADVYGQNSGTSKKNNRILNSVAAGQSSANLLKNGGFEKYSGTTASGWSHNASGGTIALVKTGARSGKSCYELYNSDMSKVQSIQQSVTLEAGKTYTASVYVNTSGAGEFATGWGAYLRFLNSANEQVVKGTILQYRTDPVIDGGWQRISVTYTPASSGTYHLQLLWRNAQGTLRADDVQLEIGDAPGSYNHVYNGSFENGKEGWTVSDANDFAESGTAVYGSKSYRMNGKPGYVLYAEQEIPINKSSDTTFLLSGWSKGTSIPDLEKICDELTDKFWGITVKLKYTDGTSEKHHLPFNEYITDWQYAAMAVVPKEANKTIQYAEVRACYFNNANLAYFDNISLTEEPAQTYTYNDKGDVVSVKSTGNGEESYSYNSTTQNLMSVGTSGSGNYTYKYENAINKHLPTSITNDTVTMDITYDGNGQAARTTLKNSQDSWKMESSAAYGSSAENQGLLMSQTDNTGATTTYTYNGRRQVEAVKSANDQEIRTVYEDVLERPALVYQSGVVSAGYEYANGNIKKIIRGGYIADGGTKQLQTYKFTYDDFGNRVAAYVGNRQLAGYTYNGGNGTLKNISYGTSSSPLAKINYGYDKLDRVKTAAYQDMTSGTTTSYGYNYSADGNLSGITENGNLKYTYEYDSLGRLIYSSRLNNNGSTVLFTKHQYDTSDRLTNQSWQIGNEVFSENYTYSTTDGTLISMTTGGDSLGFTYNNLKQLSKRTSPKVDVSYNYRTRDSEKQLTTNQVETVQYLQHGTTTQLLPTLKYTYDSLWNITKVEEGTTTAAQYTYDDQNQLTTAVLPTQTSNYVYDTYGNIRSKTNSYSDGTSDSYSYSYTDSDWLDLLTKVSYTDKNGTTATESLTYDIIGNPLSYFNGKADWTFTWKNGRQLSTATNGSTSITNTYDVDGIRETKTVNGVKHTYTYLGEKLARETYGSNVIDYFYDSDGRPYKFTVKEGSTTYTGYFVLNLQGDVIAIIDSNGAVAVEYEYDAWGKEISHTTSGSYGSKLYSYNVLKYRGYYYDAETGFYYVSSRYYDPEVGRFISADTTDVLTVSQTSLREKNLYAYCNNNPIINADQNGTFAHVVIGAVVGAGFEIAAQLVANNGDFGSINWGKVGVATAVGGITTLTGPLLGAAISGAGNGAMEALSGTTSLSKVMTSIAVGAGASLIGTGVGEVTKKIGGKIVVKSLEKKGSTVIKNTVLSKISVKGTERNMVKNLTWAVKKYPKLPGALLGKNIPQTFNSLAVGISGYGTMGAIYGIK